MAVILLTGPWAVITSPEVLAQHVSNGSGLYAQFCSECHGDKLQGQPDWKRRNAEGRLPAPPHDATGHTWHHSDCQLMRIVKIGPAGILPGYVSDMPGFADTLTDSQITEILNFIRASWPERQRSLQQAKTASDSACPASL